MANNYQKELEQMKNRVLAMERTIKKLGGHQQIQPKTLVNLEDEQMLIDLIREQPGFQKCVKECSKGNLDGVELVYHLKKAGREDKIYKDPLGGYTREIETYPMDELMDIVEERYKGRTLSRITDGNTTGYILD